METEILPITFSDGSLGYDVILSLSITSPVDAIRFCTTSKHHAEQLQLQIDRCNDITEE